MCKANLWVSYDLKFTVYSLQTEKYNLQYTITICSLEFKDWKLYNDDIGEDNYTQIYRNRGRTTAHKFI